MLRASARNTEAEAVDGAYEAPATRMGDELKRALHQLHRLIDRVEDAAVARPIVPFEGPENEALAALQAENHHLKDTENRLQRQLDDMRHQHQAVSGQVSALSARLETLLAHLSRLLEE